MIVFAIETVTRTGSLALLTDGTCRADRGDGARTHGERLPGDAIAFLGDLGLTTNDVDVFAIVAGPGSFTGLRIGMASVQGFALPRRRQVAAVPTLDALAEGWRLAELATAVSIAAGQGTEQRTIVVSCLDGQRGDVFFAAWEIALDEPVESAPAVLAPGVGTPIELARALATYAGQRPIVMVGDGHKYEAVWDGLQIELREPASTLAEVAARVAARRPELAAPPHALRPLYIRRPDAVLARERAALNRGTRST
jgi:tRNA threonylcarbamoyladenosine biosynthesis protein TsaB